MFHLSIDRAPTTYEESVPKRQKLDENTTNGSLAPPPGHPKSLGNVEFQSFNRELGLDQNLQMGDDGSSNAPHDAAICTARAGPEMLSGSSTKISQTSDASGQHTHSGQHYFHKLPVSAALGVGDSLLRKVGVSRNASPSPWSDLWQASTQPLRPRLEEEHLLAPDRAYISAPEPAAAPETSQSVPENFIDLTKDDEDDVVVTGARKLEVQEIQKANEVCYGAIKSGFIRGTHVPAFPPERSQSSMCLKIARGRGIYVYDHNKHQFGRVDENTTRALVQLMDHRIFRIELYLYPFQSLSYGVPGEPVPPNTMYPFFCNVYGPEAEGKRALSIITYNNVSLGDPHETYFKPPHKSPLRAIPVVHQQAAAQQYVTRTAARRIEFSFVSRTAEEVRADVNKVFDGLDQAEDLPEMDPDPRITTPLLRHQRQGLHFLTTKERSRTYSNNEKKNLSLWRKKEKDGQVYFYHVITGQQTRRQPPDVLGGILADMMGLGKTLQVLSLVVATQEDSHTFARSHEPPILAGKEAEPLPPIVRAKTTLLVSPLSTISNWEEQIQAHVQAGAIKFHLYHGSRRETDPMVIAGFDLVITTYQVIASEWSKHVKGKGKYFSPLQKIKFFRIVLDGEAHMIREQNTLQSKAVIALHAERRWAVTGTPVQNRIDDLAALTKFLQVKPFDDKSVFNQHISMPLKNGDIGENGDNTGLLTLRLLVDSITLRRQKDKIDLPERKDQIVYLEFSPAEREIYDATAKQSSMRVDMVAKQGHIGGKNYVHILQMILRLRLICAHGRELLGDEDTADLAGLTSSDAINVDEIDDSENATNLPAKQAYQIFSLMKETNEDLCSICDRKAVYKDPLLMADESTKAEDKGKEKEADGKEKPKGGSTIGYLTPCAHMLCGDCMPSYTARISEHSIFRPGIRAVCPICGLYNKIHLFELKSDELHEHLHGAARKTSKKKGIRYRGPSTKVKALVQSLLENRLAGAPEDPVKSVVFSAWTSHIDLIERALDDNHIRYVRLDGSQSRAQRSAAIAQFRDDVEMEVIIVSLMAGGLGLNLTAACRVYVMEPQWNPAAEAQAIDRIHRLGQKKPVVTVRYIMADSFEEKILKIQEKKTQLANMTMEQGPRKRISKEQLSRQRLEHLRSLFKDNQ